MRQSLPSFLTAALIALGACGACAPEPPADDAAPPSPRSADAPGAHADASTADAVLPWIADDYPAALAEARERDLPVFVESWAPW